MARDPTERHLIRLESRHFVTKCDGQIALIRRADALREVARLATIALPYLLSDDFAARDAQRSVLTAAEDKARELISDQIHSYLRAEPIAREKIRHRNMDTWANLTGPLAHLRPWAISKLNTAEQSRPAGT
ncbi:MAG: hypothetical protein KJ787_06185 [Gammaproteobacteria bacterium]|nr:hypothetical protein [Gammaproteobacteria bacterium]MBU1645903.1 hypothetical protein [Gammaproteobacteria bacterium]MBU1971965.1 hypothetical protein [Gammaproteobacteria bacterium]